MFAAKMAAAEYICTARLLLHSNTSSQSTRIGTALYSKDSQQHAVFKCQHCTETALGSKATELSVAAAGTRLRRSCSTQWCRVTSAHTALLLYQGTVHILVLLGCGDSFDHA
jgi:hypothetical protein